MQQPFTPIDFHCHGIGRFDFTEPDNLLLDELERHLAIEGVRSILTLYLPKSKIGAFEMFVANYAKGRRHGDYKHILGIALEGPVLASFGGTPERGCWHPTIKEWQRIAMLGSAGLAYVVISPDAIFDDGEDHPPSVTWVISELMANGVMPAFGHFSRTDPHATAAKISAACEYVKANRLGPIVTDHLFNDMPLAFKHAWRTASERTNYPLEIAEILAAPWNDENLVERLGPVPAALIKYAKQDVLRLCMNFDGDHVDLGICKKTVELVGAHRLMLMTDRIQSRVLGGQRLRESAENSLLYQQYGIVAGGTQSVMRQIGNMMRVGISSDDILNIAHNTAAELLNGRTISAQPEVLLRGPVNEHAGA